MASFLSSCMDPPDLETISRTLQFLRDIQALKPRLPLGTDSVPTAQLSRMSKRQRNRLLEGAIEVGTAGSPVAEDNDVLTPLGHHMANLPMDPQCAKLLILGAFFCCLKPALAVSACLAFKEPFEVPLGSEALADACRVELTEGSQSDHWAFYIALSVSPSLTA